MTTTPACRRFPSFVTTPQESQGPAISKPLACDLAFGLSEDQLDCFWTNGYVSLPGLFDVAEIQAISDAADTIYNDTTYINPYNTRYNFSKSSDKDVVWKIDPFFDLHPILRKCVFDRRILDPLASIYEGREPRLFKDKLIYKPAHSKGNYLHQDYNWWQGFPTSLISVTVSIDHTNEDNGCTVIYPRDPQLGFIGEKGAFKNEPATRADPSFTPQNAVKNITKPGDVLLFHCFTPHEAGPNNTDKFRRQMFLTYNDSGDGEHYFSHGDHYRHYYRNEQTEPHKYYFL